MSEPFFDHFTTKAGETVWSVYEHHIGQHEYGFTLAISSDVLYVRTYFMVHPERGVARLKAGESVHEVMGKKGKLVGRRIPVCAIQRIEKIDARRRLVIHFNDDNGKLKRISLWTPKTSAYERVFLGLKGTVAPMAELFAAKAAAWNALAWPLCVLGIVLLLSGFLLIGALTGPPQQPGKLGLAVAFHEVGQVLGVVGVVVISVAALAAVSVWLVRRVRSGLDSVNFSPTRTDAVRGE